MTFPSLLARFFTAFKPDRLADQVANCSRQRVWDRVAHRMRFLSGAEARGYIRVRAFAIVEEETDRLIAEEGTQAAPHREKILRTAIDSVIRWVQEQAQTSRRSALPLRRAA